MNLHDNNKNDIRSLTRLPQENHDNEYRDEVLDKYLFGASNTK